MKGSAVSHDDAGNAIAVDLTSACVFHLMRVVEWGMRAFAYDLGLLDVVTDKKSGKTVPIAFAQWEHILNQLEEKIESKTAAMPRGEDKQKALEFYHSSSAEIRSFKDAWRNHCMHTRASYTRQDAIAVWSHVERFMKTLAGHGLHEKTSEVSSPAPETRAKE